MDPSLLNRRGGVGNNKNINKYAAPRLNFLEIFNEIVKKTCYLGTGKQ